MPIVDSPVMSLTSLPGEILSDIFAYLDPVQVFRVRQVSRSLHAIASSHYVCSAVLKAHFPLAFVRAFRTFTPEPDVVSELSVLACAFHNFQRRRAEEYFSIDTPTPQVTPRANNTPRLGALFVPNGPLATAATRRKARHGYGLIALFRSAGKEIQLVRLATQETWVLPLPEGYSTRDIRIDGGRLVILTTRISTQMIFVYEAAPSNKLLYEINTGLDDLVSLHCKGTYIVCLAQSGQFHLYAEPIERAKSSNWVEALFSPLERFDPPIDVISGGVQYETDGTTLYMIAKPPEETQLVMAFDIGKVFAGAGEMSRRNENVTPSAIHSFDPRVHLSLTRTDRPQPAHPAEGRSYEASIYLTADDSNHADHPPLCHFLYGAYISPPAPLPFIDYDMEGKWGLYPFPELQSMACWEGDIEAPFGLFAYGIRQQEKEGRAFNVDWGRLRGPDEEEQSRATQVAVWMGYNEEGDGLWVVVFKEEELLVWSLGRQRMDR